jgi:general secretion pathway protein B
MSYILDALNKADNERERRRSAVPGLHSYGDAERTSAGGGVWRWVTLGTAVVLAGVLAWLWFARSEPAAPMAAAGIPPPLPQTMPQPQPQAPPQPTPMPAAAAAAPAPMPAPAPAPVPQSPAPAAMAAPAPATAVIAPPPSPIAKAPLPVAAAPKPSSAAPSASAPARLPTRNELPPELRAALPTIAVSGAVYAPAPKDRLLFANGAVLKEGDALADGLIVERIGASSSVLTFRGTRFELKH